tara:strand:- start:1846 stop:2361 length:516 start_codon:yes stop_codon:yes gene_type:complete
MLETVNLEAELKRFFKEVIKESRKNLKDGGNIASKNLYNNMDYDVKVMPNSISADLLMPISMGDKISYAEFLNYGVKGATSGKSLKDYKYTDKKPPLNKIRTWIKLKTGKFRARDLNSRAFAVQNIIYNRGIKPTEFFSKPFEKAFKTLPEELVEAYALDVEDFMEFVLKE